MSTVTLLPEFQTTPKGRARKPLRESAALLDYARQTNPRIDLTNPQVQADLQARRIRIANAVCNLKKFYGITITAERTGRKVTAYTLQLS